VLVLTPASMVGQWLEEMRSKFDLQFASSYDSLVRSEPASFWSQPRVITSIATARRAEHVEILRRQVYDLVIVDEAHHLKNRSTSNWKLVDALQKRFLLLLSATPVQNNLSELYNLLTLLKPGIFKTEREFRATYVTPGRPRLPANKERMRDLMRDVMIRNTRSQVDVRLPRRNAITVLVDPMPAEAECYQRLTQLVQQAHRDDPQSHRPGLRHLLTAAGSSPAAAAGSLQRFIRSHRMNGDWAEAQWKYGLLPGSSKETELLNLLRRNPDEKKIVFVQTLDTLDRLDSVLRGANLAFARFDGSLSGPDKDRAIERFRDEVPILLSTESGGEGRNLQFCNTLVNFDLPWNPMAIEQRIGRIHRIGQTRDVFVFNLAVRNTIEEYVLRILDEKINMFELVVGEIDSILGEIEEGPEFAEAVFSAWIETTDNERPAAFEDLADRLIKAKAEYNASKALDEELFGDEFGIE
jgi:SNF2 family DNA or RNA helicase